ncbi:MAG: FAD-dependent monooxygenase [Saprospiraceae bacterium]|nr:FAD-dependent monooxygenase [Saprospiraceae bacterium]MCF8249469.1 FAD-dependent monooxygenase [Saprospiraceae bacterium]MCF8310687.1 FAD-dependent monooxygenase [Saprospiraceae bacterium]MCF8439482.1 FAD-dependent monooxygenase [Saprospiraceae bacterium]
MKNEKNAVIVGAGLVGALWAVILAKRGYTVDVYERRSDFRQAGYIGGRSINLAMSERGWKAVEIAGIREKIEAVAIPMPGRMMHGTDGSLTFQAYGEEGQAIYSVSRGGLNIELVNIADEFDQVRFHFNQSCRGVDLENSAIRFEDTNTGVRYAIESDLIFGTDGAFSPVRNSLQKLPRFNYSQHYIESGYKELAILPNEDGSHKMDPGALHIWPRGNFMLIALPNLDGSFTCTLFLPFEGEVSFEKLQTEVEVMAFFEKYFPDVIPLMPTLVQDFMENPTSALVTVRCNPWHYRHKILLLGDASHAIVPFFGQGMNAGFEDCTILDSLMDKYDEDWSAIIEEFNANRPEDTNAIADLALLNFIEMRDKVADPKFLLWKKIEKHLHERFPKEFQSVYSMVSFNHVPYSVALAAVAQHEELFQKMLDIKDLEENWNGPEVEAVFREWLNGC